MTHDFKVGQKVKVITGANLFPEMFDGQTGVITNIEKNNTPDVMIHVDFSNGYYIWCYTQNDKNILLNAEVIE